MRHLRFVALPVLFVAIGVAGACSVYDESLLGGGGSGAGPSSGGGEDGGDGGNGSTSDGSSTASGSTGNVTTGGGCTTVDECPGEDSPCATRACEDGICSVQNEVQGVALQEQSPGDCVLLVCDGSGGVETVDDDGDLPPDDGNQCTAAACAGGAPVHVAVTDGDACDQDGGQVCLGQVCVQCIGNDDCDGSGQCSPANTCVAPQCNDGSTNGEETDTDCGGPACDPCPLGDDCAVDADCRSGECNGTCQPSCTDGVLNNGETATDCGGPNCDQCPLGSACSIDTDCDSDQCLSNVCRPRLFFSEYVEGPDPNSRKALEIFNYGNVAVDLAAADCRVKLYFNGSSTPGNPANGIVLSGMVEGFGVRVLCNSNFDPACTTKAENNGQFTGSLSFNGNDALVLECGGLVLDVLGQIGVNPGAAGWGDEPTNTVDGTLRRGGDITEGDRNGTDAFDPAAAWEGFAFTVDDLGEHF